MKNCMERLERLTKRCFEGEVTLPKTTFWLVCILCLLWGIVYGLKTAPWTHGVSIGCNNGNTDNYYEDGNGEKKNMAE